MAIPHLPGRRVTSQQGFTLLELIIAMVFLILIGGALAAVTKFVNISFNQGGAKAFVVNTARNGLDHFARESRNTLIAFNTAPGKPLGVNFDLDDPTNNRPLVRDGLLFYFDKNQTARLVDLDGDNVIDNLGVDDDNGDGKPDLVGIGLMPQEVFGNGGQDFIDTDQNGIPDDLNQDGLSDDADRLWRLVMVRFDNIDQVNDVSRWRAGQTLAENIFLRKSNPNKPLTAGNIQTIQYSNSGADFVPFDSNNDGILSETEIGNSETNDGLINTAAEIKRIGAVIVTLDLAVDFDNGRKVSITQFSSIIKPRAFEVLRANDIIQIPDVITANNIN